MSLVIIFQMLAQTDTQELDSHDFKSLILPKLGL